jgi:hypothetical protein
MHNVPVRQFHPDHDSIRILFGPIIALHLFTGHRLLIMSPRRTPSKEKSADPAPLKTGPSKNRERQLEDARHHPEKHALPHPPHKTLKKPPLPPRHTPHTRPHEEELGPHTDKPGPIMHPKQATKTGPKKGTKTGVKT